jgi:argininosuccinate lyase
MTTARGGRLPGNVDAAMERLNTSVDVDCELYREDIQGSIAHARGLGRAGIVSAEEAEKLVRGLETIRGEIERGELVWRRELEDVHMNVETRLGELVGPVAGKLHTARSRNDQVATDLRLYCRRRGAELLGSLAKLASTIVDRAESELDVLMPAYTHLQRAQPSRLSHHLMAWEEILGRDYGRIADALARANESPLGAGAVAGSGFKLDRDGVARELGFERPMSNSIDATGSRDFLMEIASALAILGVHLSRIGEEIVLWSSQEFGFMTLADGFATSSSMMPQKKNPDVAELVRGRSSRLVGAVTSLFVLEKGLPFGYDRDLQEDKRPIFEAFSCAHVSLDALAGALATATFHASVMRAALDRGHLCATDLADFLAQRGMPFREAHHVVGGLVREAERRGIELSALPKDALEAAHPELGGADARGALDPEQAVERRVAGGPARESVRRAIQDARARWQSAISTP